jgi:hypothetical protein
MMLYYFFFLGERDRVNYIEILLHLGASCFDKYKSTIHGNLEIGTVILDFF